ncbi:DNA-binding transcriptional LysR family regulator [Stackebrandtia endophytica]|uniref:DNA-binding transcriptional LysR family regulator n=1 Tax=Stackebrandtia endophytica TaxID=1496996 RepID=A0A543ATP7_9ACTN|nr:LysR family transcriptional regulator [Stackebrandtia endophytica]TQL75896.1 DNA-binding transcriptional LysR family regulator [Stackebrandtia endophytica]
MSDSIDVSGDFTFRDLQTFLSVASTGSFRAAARRMYTSQPAISRTIARLERDLGAPLLERGPRGARLTTAGMTLAQHAHRIGSMMTTLRSELVDGQQSRIRLGAAATAAGSYLAPFLAEWIPAHPTIDVEVIEDGAVKLRERLAERACDLAIVPLPVSDELEAIPLAHLSVCAYFPAGHVLDTGEETITVDDLVPYPLVVNSTGFLAGRVFTQECEASGLFPRIVYRSNVGQTLAALAEAGLGIAVFGDTVDLRGFDLRSRRLHTREGQSLGFALAVAWHRVDTPEWIRDFGFDLAAFQKRRPKR